MDLSVPTVSSPFIRTTTHLLQPKEGKKMASKALVLFILLNLLFFTYTSACGTCPPKPKPECNPKPKPKPKPKPSEGGYCPRDALKLGVCANVLKGLLDLTIGTPPVEPCCTLIQGIADLEAAACLCTAIRANILGINLNVPLSLSLLLNVCSKKVPKGFQCA